MNKICITTVEFPPDIGGVGESVYRIAKMLTEKNYEVHVVVFRSKQRLVSDNTRRRASCKTSVQDNIFVHRIKSAVRDDEQMIQDFFSDVYFYLKRLHEQHNFDLFHAFFLNETGYVTTLMAKEHNVPIINSIRGSDLHKHIFNPKTHAQTAWTLENSAWTTFVSRDLQTRGIAIAPAIALKSSAFWNSIAPINFTNLPKPPKVSQLPGIIIGSTGRFREKKGIEFLFDACAELSTEIELTLLLIGDFVDKERIYWEQQVEKSGLGDRLHITGIISREEALAYLPHLDIYVIPSLHDGCPNAMLEAMLAEKPIVGTKADAIGEILADGSSGLIVEPGSAEELAIAIKTLATNPQLRQKLGAGAREKVLRELAPAVERENWLKVYQKALDRVTSQFIPAIL
jgi:glycosyltransferase involved in cell wall biosynthesis